jgi:hypothetical protein
VTRRRTAPGNSGATSMQQRSRGPAATLGELHRCSPWVWIYCEKRPHRSPMAFAPVVIRWGPNASSDKLRQAARCTACGHKGAPLQYPSWAGENVGFQPFSDEGRRDGCD